MTDNEKIAKFMGRQLSPAFAECMPDWNTLMPVVEKIEQVIKDKLKELGPEITELDDPKGWRAWDYRRVHLTTNIKHVYEETVEFIDWYETQKGMTLEEIKSQVAKEYGRSINWYILKGEEGEAINDIAKRYATEYVKASHNEIIDKILKQKFGMENAEKQILMVVRVDEIEALKL